MGKALILIVLGAGIILAKQLYNSAEGGNRTATDQRNYQEQLLAREIATSAFNVGMGEIRSHGNEIRAAVTAFNGPLNAGRTGTFKSGKYAGGTYTVRAEQTSGHSVRLIATGFYGAYQKGGETLYRGEFTMHDEYRVNVLIAREKSVVDVRFIESMAGHCSAIFYQAYPPGTPVGARPDPVLVYSPDKRDRRAEPARAIIVLPGTQMNFFIAVDQNCSERQPAMSDCQGRAYATNYALDLTKYNADGTAKSGALFDHLHYALEVEAGHLDQVTEAVWGLVEQNPSSNQRWRIAWEDIHNSSWDKPGGDSPTTSLQALKRLGYDGLGWVASEPATGYALLRDYGSRPDFSDQVVEVTLTPTSSADGQARIAAERAALTACGQPVPPEFQPDPEPTPTTTTTTSTDGGTTPTTTSTSSTPPESDGPTCRCQGKDKKVALMHRPPGNESNEHVICISVNGLNGHKNHNDYQICTGS